MTLSSPGRTPEQTVAAIQALDLSMIKFKATRGDDGYGWSEAYADQMEVAYKRYLILHAKYPDMQLAPEQDVDRFWHMHILDTRKYADDCEVIFGYFLHHFPYLGLRGDGDEQVLQDAFEKMQQLHLKEFGEPMGAAKRDAAWCSVEPPPQLKAAWCSFEPPPQAAAWCSVEPPPKSAAWCSVEPPPRSAAAWCSFEPPPQGAANEARAIAELH
ncbi:hypothetical protein HLB44_32930 [Aquincola sp. S2]|uniref:Glycine-rich domain-containing protein-like n=1 Tax=Pseudaquabacterium terrae TaxID=2732868 RepID=A0ABX2ETJ3_9BURK|nr:hypothetical protein [Aquabacterium terrae]NRF71801.1 hypothetical protein [Aquabacterium terrae]